MFSKLNIVDEFFIYFLKYSIIDCLHITYFSLTIYSYELGFRVTNYATSNTENGRKIIVYILNGIENMRISLMNSSLPSILIAFHSVFRFICAFI